MSSSVAKFNDVMNATEFYRNGRPTVGVLTNDDLLDPGDDKHFKYRQAVEEGKLGATAIFELSDAPCIYFKYLADDAPSDRELADIRRLAWNQGLAPVLWVVTPTTVRIYNCYSKPRTDKDTEHRRHLIRTFDNIAKNLESLNNFAGRLQFESGAFWQRKEAGEIDRNQRVDKSLLKDLAETEKTLISEGLPVAGAHALLGRCIFTAYLQDREILKPQFFRAKFGVERFADILVSKPKTDRLFEWIRETFNGDLFPPSPNEAKILKKKHLTVVKRLLDGTSQSGQMRLWPYKFDVIPIEMISSIYEMFTHSADGKEAKKRSTHYTPINLVDLVLSQVFKGVPASGKILDMSCGSGVFLVESLRRLVGLRLAGGENLDRKLIRNTLYNQIFGIDISREAIQIAAFSLYLTLLELDPNPQPPSELKFKPLIGSNLFGDDAFDEEAGFNRREPFASKDFAAIVGNPPWTRMPRESLNARYCRKHDYPTIQAGTPDQAFLWRAGDFASTNTTIGLILHGKHFFSHTPKAHRTKDALLSRFMPKLLINLADIRKAKLFPTAVAPALIFIGRGCPPKPGDCFTFVAARGTGDFRNHGIINIDPENVKRLPTAKAASDPDMFKVASWGSARDMRMIERMRSMPGFLTLEEIVRRFSWPHGRGLGTGGTIKLDDRFPKKFLASGKMQPFTCNISDLQNVDRNLGFRGGHSDPSIYKGPLLIALRGLQHEQFYSALVEENVLYTDLYIGFSTVGCCQDYRFLLNGILNSDLANYFLFMTASSWGVERSTVQQGDLLRLPVPDPQVVPRQRLKAVVDTERKLATTPITGSPFDSCRKKLNKAVRELYDVDDKEYRVLIKDALYITMDLRQRRGASRALKRPTMKNLTEYSEQVIDVIQPLLSARNQRDIVAEILDAGRSPLSVVNFRMAAAKSGRRNVQTVKVGGLNEILHKIERNLGQKIIDQIYSRRLVRVYSGDDLYIIKPAELRYWSESAALDDADEMIAEHLGGERGIQ